jgi:hypothetical protein
MAAGLSPYYERGGITIYNGDCRVIAPQLGHFDLLLTDPPYGIGRDGSKKSTGSHGGRKAYDYLNWDHLPPDRWVLEMLLSKADKHIVWGGNYFMEALPPSMKWLVWDKGQRIAQSDDRSIGWRTRVDIPRRRPTYLHAESRRIDEGRRGTSDPEA